MLVMILTFLQVDYVISLIVVLIVMMIATRAAKLGQAHDLIGVFDALADCSQT